MRPIGVLSAVVVAVVVGSGLFFYAIGPSTDSTTGSSTAATSTTGVGSTVVPLGGPPANTTSTSSTCTVTGQPTGIFIRVLDGSGGPIEGVTVNSVHWDGCGGIRRVDASTNASGIASLDPTNGGYYLLTLLDGQYRVYGYQVDLHPLQTAFVTLDLPSESIVVLDCFYDVDPWSGSAPTGNACAIDSSNVYPLPFSQIGSLYASHLESISSLNLTSIMGGYESNATLVFGGPAVNATGCAGTYHGQAAVGSLFKGFLSQFGSLTLTNSTYSAHDYQDYATVKASLDFIGTRSGTTMPGRISGETVYFYTDGEWVISYEVWSFTSYGA